MIRAIIFHEHNRPKKNATMDEVMEAIQKPGFWAWVSLENATTEEMTSVLRDRFHFHPLAIEDVESTGYQTPKVDDFGDYLFIIMHGLTSGTSLRNLETIELNLFLAKKYLVTCYHDPQMQPIQEVWEQISRDERLYSNGSDFLCHAVLDFLVDDYMPLIDQMDEEIEWLEDQVLSKPDPNTLERILDLKHAVMSLRRIISPQREVANRLSRDDFNMIDRQSRIYFRDIYDHLVRFQDMTEQIRDIVSGAMDIYLSSTSLRLNEVMKVLTIISTIFLPLSFLAGVYGMNFKYMPELNSPIAYPLIWLTFFLVGGGMLAFFKARKWF